MGYIYTCSPWYFVENRLNTSSERPLSKLSKINVIGPSELNYFRRGYCTVVVSANVNTTRSLCHPLRSKTDC